MQRAQFIVDTVRVRWAGRTADTIPRWSNRSPPCWERTCAGAQRAAYSSRSTDAAECSKAFHSRPRDTPNPLVAGTTNGSSPQRRARLRDSERLAHRLPLVAHSSASVVVDVGKQMANRNAECARQIVEPLKGNAAAPVFDLDQVVPAHACL